MILFENHIDGRNRCDIFSVAVQTYNPISGGGSQLCDSVGSKFFSPLLSCGPKELRVIFLGFNTWKVLHADLRKA